MQTPNAVTVMMVLIMFKRESYSKFQDGSKEGITGDMYLLFSDSTALPKRAHLQKRHVMLPSRNTDSNRIVPYNMIHLFITSISEVSSVFMNPDKPSCLMVRVCRLS